MFLESVAVRGELGVDGRDVRERVRSRGVDDVDDEARPLDVTEELLSESRAAARALDESGYVRDDELALELTCLTRFAILGDARRASRARHEARVTATTATAARHDHVLVGCDEVSDDLPARRILHSRTRRHAQDEIAALFAGLVRPGAGTTARGTECVLVAVVTERCELRVDPQDHVAAATPLASVGAAARHMRFAAERDHTLAAVTRLHGHSRAVEEHLGEIPSGL